MSVTPKEKVNVRYVSKTYSTGGGFFINPVNTTKKLEGLVILNEDVKKGSIIFTFVYNL